MSEANKQAPEDTLKEALQSLTDEGNEIKNSPVELTKKPEETPKPEAEKPKEETPKEEPKKDEGKKDEETPKEEPNQEDEKPRKSKYVPAWKLEVEKKALEQKLRDEFQKTLEEERLKNINNQKPEAKEITLSPNLKEFAERYQLKEEFVDDLVRVFGKDNQQSPELLAKLKEIEEFKERMEDEADNLKFQRDFDKNVLSSIKAEYPDATQETIDKIRERVKVIAYTEKWEHTPLAVIYKGLDEFRGIVRPPKKTAEPTHSGGDASRGSGLPVDGDSVTDEDLKKMDDATFLQFLQTKTKKK